MAVEIVMPRLGWTMETGSIVEWIKKDGDSVQPGDILFTVESDKAVNEIEAFDAGILRIPPDSPPLGESVPIGRLLAYLVAPGEAAPFETASGTAGEAVPAALPAAAPGATGATGATGAAGASVAAAKAGSGRRNGLPAISPRARRAAEAAGLRWAGITGSGRTGRIIERDIRAALAQGGPTVAAEPAADLSTRRVSPVARRMAEQLNVDLDALAAALPERRIAKADVVSAAAGAAAGAAPAAPSISAAPPAVPSIPEPTPGAETRQPISTTRRVIATRMAASAHTAAPVTLTTECDATALVMLRRQLKADGEATGRPVPTYNDLLGKLAAEALLEHPALNARLDGDSIITSAAVHLGVAVHTERGLLVPVIRDAHAKSVRQIARESEALIAQARAATLSSAAMSGGTFTITNLGMFGIDAFTPIINLPECAILGVGRIVPKPVVTDPETELIAVRHMLWLSLTFDHRVVDGAPAAQFLARLCQLIAHPHLSLL